MSRRVPMLEEIPMPPRLESRRLRVYVAGKYNDSNVIDVLGNIRRGLGVSLQVLRTGWVPFIPWLDWLLGLYEPLSELEFKDYSMEWLKACDCVLLCPAWEGSKGTQAEIAEATRRGIPVFVSIECIKHWLLFSPSGLHSVNNVFYLSNSEVINV